MINCTQIEQEANELKMKMTACKVLKAEDMQKLLDLVLALHFCKCDCVSTDLPNEVYSFQFNDLTSDISDINVLTLDYLNTNGLQHSEPTLTTGKNINFTETGRYGFVVFNAIEYPYFIYDNFSTDITDAVFDTSYDPVNKIFYYVSKEYITPSVLFFKFVKQ